MHKALYGAWRVFTAQCIQTIALAYSLPTAYLLQVKRKKIKIFTHFKIVKLISRHKKKKLDISLEKLFHISLTGNFTICIQCEFWLQQ